MTDNSVTFPPFYGPHYNIILIVLLIIECYQVTRILLLYSALIWISGVCAI